MKILISICLLLWSLCSFGCYQVPSNINAIFKQLQQQLPAQYHTISLTLINDYNAYAGYGYIEFGKPLMVKTNPDVWALILGHEFGHEVLGHESGSYDTGKIHYQQEQDADEFGMFLYMKAGYCLNQQILTDYYNMLKQSKYTQRQILSHGTGETRVQNMRNQFEYMNDLNSIWGWVNSLMR